jgi:hypothetical protein
LASSSAIRSLNVLAAFSIRDFGIDAVLAVEVDVVGLEPTKGAVCRMWSGRPLNPWDFLSTYLTPKFAAITTSSRNGARDSPTISSFANGP